MEKMLGMTKNTRMGGRRWEELKGNDGEYKNWNGEV